MMIWKGKVVGAWIGIAAMVALMAVAWGEYPAFMMAAGGGWAMMGKEA